MRDAIHDRMSARQWLSLLAIALAAWKLVAVVPTVHDTRNVQASGREGDYSLLFHSQQLFGRNPEELRATELDDVNRWSRCLQLACRHQTSGIDSLSDEQCAFVMETLCEFCPNIEDYAGYLGIYQSCAIRLATTRPLKGVALNRSPNVRPMRRLLE